MLPLPQISHTPLLSPSNTDFDKKKFLIRQYLDKSNKSLNPINENTSLLVDILKTKERGWRWGMTSQGNVSVKTSDFRLILN